MAPVEMCTPLTVLIPTHGRPALLKRTLESITRCELPDAYRELVVIENGSRAGAEALVEALPARLNARYMHRERGNKSYALNEALETIDEGLVVFFDDDITVHKDTLFDYAEAAKTYSGGVYLGGNVIPDFEHPPSRLLKESLPLSEKGYRIDSNAAHSFFLGFNWAAFALDIHRLGGFDPLFGPGSSSNAKGQESDMQSRMREKGIVPIGVEGATVKHYVPKRHSGMKRIIDHQYRKGLATVYMSGGTLRSACKAVSVSMGVLLRDLALGYHEGVLAAFMHIVYQWGRGVGIMRCRMGIVDSR